MLKIAISGHAGSGKNTVASLIAEDILHLKQEQYQISAFANKIKELITSLFPGCSQESLYGSSELRQNKITSQLNEIINTEATYRQVALDMGKLGRSYNSSFWVAQLALEYFKLPEQLTMYAVADLRFCEEYNWLKSQGFMLCRVKRDNLIKVNDISETEQEKLSDDMFDVVIDNNSTVAELKEKLTNALDMYYRNNKTYLQVRHANG
jgi:hypothetical protein